MKILVTGAAGFIGMHVAQKLLHRGDDVIGIDCLNDYYDKNLKLARLKNLASNHNFKFQEVDISNIVELNKLFEEEKPQHVINLAAQVGVRYSLVNPHAYTVNNILGFANILEACRHNKVEHLVYASSSSVYGGNQKIPFSSTDRVDSPISFYAATKKSNELMAYSYSHLYGLPTTGLRYFTVYGPWGRPDMAPWLFTKAILEDRPIKIFNYGLMKRDFTYVDDIAEGTVLALNRKSNDHYKIYNIGGGQQVELNSFIRHIEHSLGKEAKKEYLDIQPGDVVDTFADVEDMRVDFGFEPKVSIDQGIANWVSWYKKYHAKEFS